MTTAAARIALQGLGLGMSAVQIAVQGLLNEQSAAGRQSADGVGTWVISGDMWRSIRGASRTRRARSEEALLMGRLYLT